MYLPQPNVISAKLRNHAEYLARFSQLETLKSGDPIYWWSMVVADDGRAALKIDQRDLPYEDEDGNQVYHSITEDEVSLLIEELPAGWNASDPI